jgi:oxygen-dependent protoporphyrinogen oxidase
MRAGRRVTLFEARGGLGGRMRSDELDGTIVDVAVQLLSSTYHRLRRLAQETGTAHRIVRSPGRDALWRGGRSHIIAYGSVPSMITSSALPASLKFRLATRYLPFLKREAAGLDANDPAKTGGVSLDGSSVASWGRELLGDDFVELLAYPLLATYCGGGPEQMSAAMYHALARVGMDVRVLAVRGGMSALSEGIGTSLAAHGAEIRTGTKVDAVRVQEDSIEVLAPHNTSFDAVVLAMPPRAVRDVLNPEGPLASWLSQVRSQPTATVALFLAAPVKSDWFVLSIPRSEEAGQRLVALCAEESKGARLVRAGRGLLVAYPSPMFAAQAAQLEPAEVVDMLLPAIEAVLPGTSKRVTRARVYRFEEGYSLFYPGYLRHLAAYEADWLPRSIALAGDYLVAPTVEGALISGERAAARLLRLGVRE